MARVFISVTIRLLCLATALVGLSASLAPQVRAGEFTLDWSVINWPAGSTTPLTTPLRDQYGFEIDATISVSGDFAPIGSNPFPDDGNFFGGNVESLIFVADAPFNQGQVGDASTTATLAFTSGGIAFPVDGLSLDVLDIDASDNNNADDRCDFVTLTGDNGNPALAALDLDPTVIVGPGFGSGATGALAANQAQCVFFDGPTPSPTSPNDTRGTIRASYPDATSSATVTYDESIGNVRPSLGYNPVARGIGVLGEGRFTVGQTITLDRSVTPSTGVQGESVTYTYVVTNTGALPFNTGQDILIEDDLLGTVTCPAISTPIAPGGSVTCSAPYTVTATDVLTGSVDSSATAGIGRIGQPFVARLQSDPRSLSLVTSVVTGGGPGALTCTPVSVFRQPRTQLAGSGSPGNLTTSDIFVYDNVTSDSSGNDIDVVFQVTSIARASQLELGPTLEARMTPRDDARISYRLRMVEDGSATAATPLGTPVDQSRINGVIVQQTDVDSRGTGDDSTDVVGPLTAPDTISHFNTAPLVSYPGGGTPIGMDPAKNGNPLNWVDEPNESSFDNFTTYEYSTFVEAEFLHGYTGQSSNRATRGSGILLCAIAATSAEIIARDDDYTATPINTVFGGTTGEVLVNDTVNGLPAAFPTVTLDVLTPAQPQSPGDLVPILEVSGPGAGRVTVPAGVPAGVYTIDYRLCDAVNTTDCDRARVTIAVYAGDGLDFGDAPISYLTPSHGVPLVPTVFLGTVPPDIELLAQTDSTATADDLLDTDDEDGVVFPVLTQGAISTLDVVVVGTGNLQAWIDFNGDGLFEESLGERIATDLRDDGSVYDNVAGDGVIQVDVAVPTDATTSTTFARFRYSSEAGLNTSDVAVDGEVEDYSLLIAAADLVDRGDAPASYGDPRHAVVPEIYLGSGLPDTEVQPQNSVLADADDLSGADDEDSIAVFPVLEAGTNVQLTVQTHETLSLQYDLGFFVASGVTNLQLWIDFDRNGVFDPAEQVATNYRDGGAGDLDGVFNNQITLNIPVPATIASGYTYARLRWSTSSAVTQDPFDGLNFDGEVEDYRVALSAGAVPFSCDGSLYRISRFNSQLQRLEFVETSGFYSVNVSNVGTAAGSDYDGGWGYNPQDGLMYAVATGTRDLVQLDSQGNFTDLGPLPGSVGLGGLGGDFLPDGTLIYRIQGTSDFQLLDLSDPANPVDQGQINLSASVDIVDVAYNPNDQMIYGINRNTGRLF
ncbi:GEVED domain-containing protein [Pseudooceanicola aestuarii]|uniref:GEVED domain-containing protein n=1 Tax=Pseudooceanicola aestuarii TaxID=2697319 RepID=UPI001EF88606|nr:GEVED domain-containing protein [Pseudooceanicola aestuarii]